jgi:hypothetical protein
VFSKFRNAVFAAGLMVGSVAFAQPPVANGEDLIAWQTLENRTLTAEQAADAYRGFVLQFNDSPLAEMAYARLVALGMDAPWTDDATVLSALGSVRNRFEAHQKALATPPKAKVAMIDLSEDDDDATAARDTGR